MKKSLKVTIITIASAILLAIIVFILTVVFTLSGIGNPIIRSIAQNQINQYIEKAYPNNDFEKINVRYNFKFGDYGAHIASKSSADTNFYVSYEDGECIDSYDDYVLSGMNTYNRICGELDQQVESIMISYFGDQIELFIYDIYSTKSKSDSMQTIVQNVGLDEHIEINALNSLDVSPAVTVWFISDTMSFEILAEKFSQTKALMVQNNIPADEYSISLRFPEDMIEGRHDEHLSAHDFPVEFINSDEFMEKLIEFDRAGREITDKEK